MTTHPKREYTPEQIESMANSLLKIPTSFGKEPRQAALMLRSLASQLAAQKREGEPVAWIEVVEDNTNQYGKSARAYAVEGSMELPLGKHDLYTHPQQRNAVEVTDGMVESALKVFFSHKDGYDRMGMRAALEAAISVVASRDREDAERFDFIERECLDLRCVEYEDDFYFVVVEHYMGEPKERVIGTGAFPRQAIDAARRENKP